jgi:hypothetical protein
MKQRNNKKHNAAYYKIIINFFVLVTITTDVNTV